MLDAIRMVRDIAPQARLDCCPYEGGDDGTGYFVRIGTNGHWLSKVRKTPRAGRREYRIMPRLRRVHNEMY